MRAVRRSALSRREQGKVESMQPDDSRKQPAQISDAPCKALLQDLGLFAETVRLIAPELAVKLDFGTTASLD